MGQLSNHLSIWNVYFEDSRRQFYGERERERERERWEIIGKVEANRELSFPKFFLISEDFALSGCQLGEWKNGIDSLTCNKRGPDPIK